MEVLTIIFALSAILWYLIERGKTELWGSLSYGKWITIAIAAIGSFALTFGFKLDIINALGLSDTLTIPGQILTGFALMSGSSAVSEILTAVKGLKKDE